MDGIRKYGNKEGNENIVTPTKKEIKKMKKIKRNSLNFGEEEGKQNWLARKIIIMYEELAKLTKKKDLCLSSSSISYSII